MFCCYLILWVVLKESRVYEKLAVGDQGNNHEVLYWLFFEYLIFYTGDTKRRCPYLPFWHPIWRWQKYWDVWNLKKKIILLQNYDILRRSYKKGWTHISELFLNIVEDLFLSFILYLHILNLVFVVNESLIQFTFFGGVPKGVGLGLFKILQPNKGKVQEFESKNMQNLDCIEYYLRSTWYLYNFHHSMGCI